MQISNLAGVGKRIVALIIDWIVLTIAQGIIGSIFLGGMAVNYSSILSDSEPNPEAITALLVASMWQNLISLIMYICYEGYLTSSSRQGTLGKMAMKIKVVDEQGMRLSRGTAFLRAGMKIISSMVCCIGFLVALFNKEEQSLHDLIAKTYVVND